MSGELPQRIGRYGIWGEIGRGSMGVVYEAYDPELERAVALKTIGTGFAVSAGDREAFEARFFAEGRIAARLSHPGIVVIHDTGRDPESGVLFMVLERLRGRPLAQLLQEGPLAWRLALQIAGGVAEALHHAHGLGVIHRDIKPANVMVLPDGEPKIMDFGIAKIETARMKLTLSGQFFGTPLYMSPEQALGRKIDHRVDLFALGAVLHEMLTGQPAFGAKTLSKVVGNVVLLDPGQPSALVPGLPPEVDYIVARALAKDRAFRYPDGRTMAEDAADVLAGRMPRHREGWQPPPPGALPEVTEQQAARLREEALLPPPADDELEPLILEEERPEAIEHPPQGPTPVSNPAATQPPATPPRSARTALRGPLAVAVVGLAGVAVGVAIGAMVTVAFRRANEPEAAVLASPPPATAQPAAEGGPGPIPTPPSTTLPVTLPPAESPPPAALPAPRPARLAIELEHSLETGILRVWIDDDLSIERRLDGETTKKLLVLKGRKGSLAQTLDVSPGEHEIRVDVAWDDNVKTRRIAGTFRPGSTRRLGAKLGGLLKKNLSLEWQ
jgi:serine/threonine protein kinase